MPKTVKRFDAVDLYSEVEEDEDDGSTNDGAQEPDNLVSRYFDDIRVHKVTNRKQERIWFAELDTLYRKIIACVRMLSPVRTLLKDCVRMRFLDEENDDSENGRQRAAVSPWWRFWWRDRDWKRIDTSVRTLQHAIEENTADTLELFAYKHVSERISPYYERAVALRQEIARHNLRLVISEAKRYKTHFEFLDVIQEGNIGLWRAIDKFMLKKGWKLSTYAVNWIRQHMRRASFEEGGIVHIPSNLGERQSKLRKAENDFIQERGRVPSPEELASVLGWDIEWVRHFPAGYISLSQPFGFEDGQILLERLKSSTGDVSEGDLFKEGRVAIIKQALVCLTPREGQIIDLRCGLSHPPGLTLQEIADLLVPPLSRERVRQLERQAHDRIKNNPQAMALLAKLL